MIDISLEPEGAGWLAVSIHLDGKTWKYCASDLGPDLCAALVALATKLCGGDTFFADVITMYGEPDGMSLHVSNEAEQVTVRIFHTPNLDAAPPGDLGECLAKAKATQSEVCLAAYRAARSLLATYGLAYLAKEWQEFPIGSFLRLHEALEQEPKLEGQGLKSEARWLQRIGNAEPGVGADSR